MKIKRIAAATLSVAVLSMSMFTAFADIINESTEVQVSEEKELRSRFMSIKGTIKDISDYHSGDGAKMVAIEDENELPSNIIITKDTYVINMDKLAVGETLTVFYDAMKPMILIYPPQISADAVIVGEIDLNVKVDLFNEELVSADNFLKLNISEDTEIVSEDGSKFEGEIYNRKLVVLYGAATKSIPAQTNPTKIIVLDEEKPVILDEIAVNGKKLEVKPFLNDDSVVMVPVRAVAEELGYEVGWNQEAQKVTVGELLSFRIGEDNYTMDDTSGIQLYSAPILEEGTTYVPLSFISEFLNASTAQVNSQVVIEAVPVTQ
ncbi:copper amine oxidase N-terminal domain-containing protein [Sedimentibacter sp.]|uniref:copper amine oxidase N-terminal domain-containing protein n=1 Tax=Sedimentibacter sp. TaxID=1960295 RepID=UPI00289F76A1|nr:copper amine oxidase N-terminal domain-containing protein [Sedimentibacter sp.]